jgi:hypothetical protein
LIVSVHIHKNAGMNFKKHILKIFNDSLILSYGRDERILERFFTKTNVPKYKKADFDGIAIVHGHFLADLFDLLATDIKYAIILRDPVERVISNYYFLKRNNFDNSSICTMIAEGLSLEGYAELNSSQNVQSFFMANKSIERFDFVGVCEEYEKSVLLFDRLFNVKGSMKNSLKYYKQIITSIFNKKSELVMPDNLTNNKNPEKQTTYYDISDKLREKIIGLNQMDYDLYEKGKTHFRINCEKFNV